MQLRRNEIMTGLLVLGTVAVLTFILILLGAPGLFRPLVTYKLYFDNASGIKIGRAGHASGPQDRAGGIALLARFRRKKKEGRKKKRKRRHARLMQLGLLGEMAIDITQGTEASGRARDGEMFAGERVPDFSEAAAKMLEVIKPVAVEATSTMKELATTSQKSQPSD